MVRGDTNPRRTEAGCGPSRAHIPGREVVMQTLTGLFLVAVGVLGAQVPNPTQTGTATPQQAAGPNAPIFRVTVVSRTIKAINYHHRSGTTQVDFRGTELLPEAR